MKAADVMVRDVVTVSPDATVHEVVLLLLKNRISGVPVVDAAGKLVGIVSEGDLLHRAEAGTEQRHSRFLSVFASNEARAAEYVKSHSRKVSDIMTKNVVTASPATSLRDIAAMLEKNGIKRVPIVDNGKLVGIVSRANLIQALAVAPVQQASVDDTALRDEVMNKINSKSWSRPYLVNALVRDGTVELWGIVSTDAEKNALRVVAEVTPGVRAVKDNLTVRTIEAWA
ncbi:MAG TPA: CBS domain-containing protein [Xanthobacteraceae bacterium]|nr:CBS domain-containing protein [Xanthobacteraceae bacterium]